MASLSQIKLPNNAIYNFKDNGALQLTGGQVTGPVTFGDSVSIDEATLGDLVVNGSASFTNNIQANTINGVTVGSSPKFTDTNTEVSAFTLATSTGTSSITLASAGKYVLTAGSKSIIFTMPTIQSVPSNIVNTITTTAGAHTAITSQKGNVSFNVPTKTSHLTNDSGFLTSHLTGTGAIHVENGEIKIVAKTAMTGGTEQYIDLIANHTVQGISGFAVLCDDGSGDGMMKFFPDMDGVSTASQAIIDQIPTKTSQLTNDSGFLTSITHQTIKQDGVTGATGNHFGTCSIAAGTAAKTVSITAGTPTLEAGLRVTVKFANANTAGTPTLNVNSLGAKNIFHNGAQITTGANKALLAGTVEFVYDGTQWQLVGNYIDTDTKAWASITGKPTATASATTGITASTTATKTTLGTAGSVTGVQSTTTTASKVTLGTAFSIAGVSGSVSVRGVKTGDNSTTTASKVTVGSHSTDYGVKSAGSGSFTQGTFTGGSLVVTNHVLSFTPATHGADSHTHTAPTLGSKVPTVSASDVTVPIRADADTTVPKAATAVSIPNVTGATDVTVPIKNSSATSIPNVSVASATVSITDPGHTHNI